jgi:hypothetical protein
MVGVLSKPSFTSLLAAYFFHAYPWVGLVRVAALSRGAPPSTSTRNTPACGGAPRLYINFKFEFWGQGMVWHA